MVEPVGVANFHCDGFANGLRVVLNSCTEGKDHCTRYRLIGNEGSQARGVCVLFLLQGVYLATDGDKDMVICGRQRIGYGYCEGGKHLLRAFDDGIPLSVASTESSSHDAFAGAECNNAGEIVVRIIDSPVKFDPTSMKVDDPGRFARVKGGRLDLNETLGGRNLPLAGDLVMA